MDQPSPLLSIAVCVFNAQEHPQTAYRKYAVLIGTIYENCDRTEKPPFPALEQSGQRGGFMGRKCIQRKFYTTFFHHPLAEHFPLFFVFSFLFPIFPFKVLEIRLNLSFSALLLFFRSYAKILISDSPPLCGRTSERSFPMMELTYQNQMSCPHPTRFSPKRK